MTKLTAVIFAAALFFIGSAQEGTFQEGTFEFAGEVPPQVPDGTVVEAMMLEDPASFGTVPLMRGEVRDGSFSILLPEKLEPELLHEASVSCGGMHRIAFVPYLAVTEDEALIGQLWRSSEEPGAWGMGGPANFTYLAYVEEAYEGEDDCWGDVIELDLQPGWNLYSRIVTDTGSLTTTADPPEEFLWRFLR